MKPRVIALAAVLVSCALAAQTQTSTNAPGPYYATPSWDQKLPSATRFIVLSNWDNQAVLDRETGLVWQRSLIPEDNVWVNAAYFCNLSVVGGRAGWRLPTFHELFRTLVAGPSHELLAGSPFSHLGAPGTYWTSTRGDSVTSPTAVYAVIAADNYVGFNVVSYQNNDRFLAWCVQSPAFVDRFY